MSIQFEHFLLTQFNVYMQWSKCITGRKLKRPNHEDMPTDEWFKHRLRLFDKYCYPSIAGQTNKNFKWMVLFDENHTNKNLLEKYDRMIPIYIDYENYERFTMYQWFSNKIKEQLNPETNWIITSRLDCDDALNKNYIKIMQEEFSPKERLLNPINGTIYNIKNKGITTLDYPRPPNPYITVIEPLTENYLKTCFRIVHWKMNGLFTVEQIRNGSPFWLQMIHDKNLNNSFRGKPANKQILDNFCIKENK